MASSGCKSSESPFSGSGEEREQGMGTGYVWVWRVGSPGCSHLPRSLVAALHLRACEMGLCRSVCLVSVSATMRGGGLREVWVQCACACVRRE